MLVLNQTTFVTFAVSCFPSMSRAVDVSRSSYEACVDGVCVCDSMMLRALPKQWFGRALKLCAFAVGCVIAQASSAAELFLGPYIGAGGGQSFFDMNFAGQVNSAYSGTGFTVESANLTDDKDGAWKLYGGWRFHRYGAIELGYLDFGSATTQYDVGVPQGVARRDGRYRLTGWETSLAGTLPVGDRATVFAKAGVLFSRLKYSESGTNQFDEPTSFSATNNQSRFIWGLGGSFEVWQALSGRLEWQRVEKVGETFALNESGNGRFDHVDLVTLSVQWQFR